MLITGAPGTAMPQWQASRDRQSRRDGKDHDRRQDRNHDVDEQRVQSHSGSLR
jgi:hypothetical protein